MYLTDLQKFCKKEENGRDKSLTIFATSTIVQFYISEVITLKNGLLVKKGHLFALQK